MLAQSKSKKPEVVISRGNTPKESLIKGVEQLGGISNFISVGDHVFIKFNLNLPGGFPINTNFDVLEALIVSCKEAGADKVYLGSFPLEGIPIKIISDLYNLKEYFKTFGADLVFLDNSDNFEEKSINQEELIKIKHDSLTKVQLIDNEVSVPNVILNSNKFISVNQINVNPLFKLNFSILNSYSIIPPKYQVIGKNPQTNLHNDQYKKDLTSNILNVFTIKQPNLVINDLFYILEGAGPYLYKDSKLKRTGLMVIGDDAIAVDLITLNLLNLEIDDIELIKLAQERDSETYKFSNIKILGEKVEDNRTEVELCISKLEEIKVKNFSVKSGKLCSGCINQAYHLLNFMKTYMGKDLKYNVNNSFLIGKNPTEPEKMGNTLLFGECAISSTIDYKFRNKIIESKKKSKKKAKSRLLKESKSDKKPKPKIKLNKNILELPGCPPNLFDCLKLILNYYGRKNVPNLNLYVNVNRFWINGKLNDKLRMWEAL